MDAYLLLGTNKGDRLRQLMQAKKHIEAELGEILQSSSIYETAAWGVENQPSFLNMVVLIDTVLNPVQLLENIHEIENKLGRIRKMKWGSRTMDIDILFYENEIIETQDLIIPHPWIQERRFTLVPLVEMAPDMQHPKLNKSMSTLLNECIDPLPAKRIENV